MPVEIRELVIKTQIQSQPRTGTIDLNGEDIKALKRQIIDACRQALISKTHKNSFNR